MITLRLSRTCCGGDPLRFGVGGDRGEGVGERDQLGVLVPGQHSDAAVQPVQQVPVRDDRRAQLARRGSRRRHGRCRASPA